VTLATQPFIITIKQISAWVMVRERFCGCWVSAATRADSGLDDGAASYAVSDPGSGAISLSLGFVSFIVVLHKV
jgi:hypothetical protein